MTIGAQLYTVREFTQNERDFDECIKKIAAIGYTCVQVSAVGPMPPETIRSVCDRHGVRITITHTDPSRVLGDTENVIAEHKILDAEFIGIGGLPQKYRGGVEAIESFAADYTPAAEKIAAAGMKFMYHNHNFEFEKYGGALIIDRLAESFPNELMGFILDTYWAQAGGADPAHYIERYAGRVEAIHFKDMKIITGEDGHARQRMCPVLEGNLNWPAIFTACGAAGVRYAFIEQDDCYGESPFDCLELSFKNLNGYGYK